MSPSIKRLLGSCFVVFQSSVFRMLEWLAVKSDTIFLFFLYVLDKLNRFHVPLPHLNLSHGHSFSSGRGNSSSEKLNLIKAELPNKKCFILDVGSNNGYYSLEFAKMGHLVCGFEPDPFLFRIASFASVHCSIRGVGFFNQGLTPQNVCSLPTADVTLICSVFHWWVKDFSFSKAKEMLICLWKSTRICMFIEMPNTCHNKKIASWMPPIGQTEDDMRTFLLGLIPTDSVKYSKCLGFLPTDFRPNEKRHLFVLFKELP